jgi:hypothetical protein
VYEDFKADIKLEGRDVDFNMSEEEIESGIEEPLGPSHRVRYRGTFGSCTGKHR